MKESTDKHKDSSRETEFIEKDCLHCSGQGEVFLHAEDQGTYKGTNYGSSGYHNCKECGGAGVYRYPVKSAEHKEVTELDVEFKKLELECKKEDKLIKKNFYDNLFFLLTVIVLIGGVALWQK